MPAPSYETGSAVVIVMRVKTARIGTAVVVKLGFGGVMNYLIVGRGHAPADAPKVSRNVNWIEKQRYPLSNGVGGGVPPPYKGNATNPNLTM